MVDIAYCTELKHGRKLLWPFLPSPKGCQLLPPCFLPDSDGGGWGHVAPEITFAWMGLPCAGHRALCDIQVVSLSLSLSLSLLLIGWTQSTPVNFVISWYLHHSKPSELPLPPSISVETLIHACFSALKYFLITYHNQKVWNDMIFSCLRWWVKICIISVACIGCYFLSDVNTLACSPLLSVH